MASFRRKPEGGFTFEVQQEIGEDLGWGFEAEAFARGVIDALRDGVDVVRCIVKQVCLTRKQAADPAIGIFDAALFPGAVRIAEEGSDSKGVAQFVMQGELGAVVLRQSTAQRRWQARQPLVQLLGGWFGLAAGRLGEEHEAGGPFLCDEDGLAISAEQHVVGFPVAWLTAGIDVERAFFHGNTVFYVLHGAAALLSSVAAFELAARQVVAPAVVLGSADLGVDEAVDGFVADGDGGLLPSEPAGDLLGGPAASEAGEDGVAQCVVAFQA